MGIQIDRVMSRLEALYHCGANDNGSHSRIAYSPEDMRGRDLFSTYFKNIGVEVYTDPAGNLIARLEGKNRELPAILTGSHLDTVIDGGRYDGALGCVAGLEVMEALVETGTQLDHPLEVIVFADEEGIRFGNSMFGSSAFCGLPLDGFAPKDRDIYGQTREKVLEEFGVTLELAEKAERPRDSVHCFVELHVEQGGILEKRQKSLGAVTSIAGVKRYEIRVYGEANHSGSTMMDERRDALAAAARFIAQVPQIVGKYGGEFSVATVGTIHVIPNAVNVIPGECRFNLEIRDQDESVLHILATLYEKKMREVTGDTHTSFEMAEISAHAPERMDPWVQEETLAACKELGYACETIPSGAFHDSLLLTERFPTGMIFVPSIGGISHSPKEDSRKGDIAKGCEVLLNTIVRLDKKEGRGHERF